MTNTTKNTCAATWEPEQEISTDIGTEWQGVAKIAVDNDRVHVVWVDWGDGDADIYYRYFNGINWQPEEEISTDIGIEGQFFSTVRTPIAVEGDKVYVVWRDEGDGDWDIYYRYFNGTSWQPEEEISTDTGIEFQGDPLIAVDGSKVHVVWVDEGDGDRDIYYRYFDGTSWQPEEEISTDIGTERQTRPSIAVDGTKVHVVWEDEEGGNDIYYRRFNGFIWLPEEEISTGPGFPWEPSIAVDGGEVYVVWEDEGDGDYDIYYRYFNGTNWQPEQEISTDILVEKQLNPSIAVDGGKVHVVWEDEGDGDFDIYYRRGTEEIGDIAPPESNANPISPYWQPFPAFDIEWTATDDYGLANISLYYKYSSDNSSWSGWEEWAYNNAISGPFATSTFSFTAVCGDGFYEFYTIANDTSGNRETTPISADAIAGVDTIPLPPNDLNAILSGNNFENITLSWSLSPDDGAGKNNAARYDIHRGSIYDSNGSSYILRVSLPAGTSSYFDTQAGEGNPSNYFYLVCAVGFSNLSSCSVNQAGKFTRPLLKGPNLVSIPLIQSDETIETVLQTVKFDKAWTYNSISGKWKWYMSFKNYRGDLLSVNHTMGLWVNVTGECNLTVAGVVPAQTTIQLHEGWNLVSFPSFNTTYTVADLKAAAPTKRVEAFDSSSPPHFLRVAPDIEVFSAGQAYWVKVSEDTTWVVSIV